LQKDKASELVKQDIATLTTYKKSLDNATKFIPNWVKVSVALALGLGTMIGWKRIVVTVGEKIGKEHLTYGQGAAAEIVAMGTIAAADSFGLPVSTTHVLSSGVAGTMAANGSGVQMSTIRSIALAWVLTLPCAMVCRRFSSLYSATCSDRMNRIWCLPFPPNAPHGGKGVEAYINRRGRMPRHMGGGQRES
jgi:PiT family inorganic phosphate transporter